MEAKNTMNQKTATDNGVHPCQYCEKPCKGKQCKDCHLKMVSKLQGKCADCETVFLAVRKDGTVRKRCKDCQDAYNDKHYAKCPDCKEQYYAFLEDGRVFSKCFDCYQKTKTINKCEKCDSKTYKDNTLCSPCYQESKKTAVKEKETRPCKKDGCKNLTIYTFCKSCNDSKRVLDSYMVSTCQKCNSRSKGNFKLCFDCKA
jgi:hypothetical protein